MVVFHWVDVRFCHWFVGWPAISFIEWVSRRPIEQYVVFIIIIKLINNIKSAAKWIVQLEISYSMAVGSLGLIVSKPVANHYALARALVLICMVYKLWGINLVISEVVRCESMKPHLNLSQDRLCYVALLNLIVNRKVELAGNSRLHIQWRACSRGESRRIFKGRIINLLWLFFDAWLWRYIREYNVVKQFFRIFCCQ